MMTNAAINKQVLHKVTSSNAGTLCVVVLVFVCRLCVDALCTCEGVKQLSDSKASVILSASPCPRFFICIPNVSV